MSLLHRRIEDPAERAHVAMLAQVHQTFGPRLTRDERNYLLERVRGVPVTTSKGWPEPEYVSVRRELWKIANYAPDTATDLLREARAATAPAIDAEALDTACRQSVTLSGDSVAKALDAMDRAAEVGQECFYVYGDAANVLLAAAPGAKKREVLAEYLKDRESLKSILCPDPSADSDPVAQLLILSRVAGRVPTDLRLAFEIVPFTYHKVAATELMTKNGLRVPPDVRTLETRLAAKADNDGMFPTPASFRAWIRAGAPADADEAPVRVVPPTKPAVIDAAWRELHKLRESLPAREAFAALFTGRFRLREVR